MSGRPLGSPVVETLCFPCRQIELHSCLGTEIPHMPHSGAKDKTKRKDEGHESTESVPSIVFRFHPGCVFAHAWAMGSSQDSTPNSTCAAKLGTVTQSRKLLATGKSFQKLSI